MHSQRKGKGDYVEPGGFSEDVAFEPGTEGEGRPWQAPREVEIHQKMQRHEPRVRSHGLADSQGRTLRLEAFLPTGTHCVPTFGIKAPDPPPTLPSALLTLPPIKASCPAEQDTSAC